MKQAIPQCFPDKESFQLWISLARFVPPPRSAWCTDCTPEYQAEMVAQNRCEHPGTKFIIDEDGFIEGRRPRKPRKRNKREAA